MKIHHVLLAAAFAGLNAAAFAAPAAIPSVPAQKGFKVLSGSLQAVVGGKTVSYKEGDEVPQQAVVTANSDATLDGGNGTTVSLSKGTSFQAALSSDNKLDIKSAGGGSVTVKGGGHTTDIPVGSEADVTPTTMNVVKGTVLYTGRNGYAVAVHEGQGYVESGVNRDRTLGVTTTILTAAPAPSPTQEKTVAPVSPSAP